MKAFNPSQIFLIIKNGLPQCKFFYNLSDPKTFKEGLFHCFNNNFEMYMTP